MLEYVIAAVDGFICVSRLPAVVNQTFKIVSFALKVFLLRFRFQPPLSPFRFSDVGSSWSHRRSRRIRRQSNRLAAAAAAASGSAADNSVDSIR
jgi:hypothetical protein